VSKRTFICGPGPSDNKKLRATGVTSVVYSGSFFVVSTRPATEPSAEHANRNSEQAEPSPSRARARFARFGCRPEVPDLSREVAHEGEVVY